VVAPCRSDSPYQVARPPRREWVTGALHSYQPRHRYGNHRERPGTHDGGSGNGNLQPARRGL